MAHIGKKFTLGLISGFGGALGFHDHRDVMVNG
ncbi:hypothetical protein SDC9_188099 [bioreactor metagenome]|uniref:Uncharacterized protein n=1 Tax=bioreactor metagenome TaxID=1076179 RepID=A0A645HNC7_9ZZZZ